MMLFQFKTMKSTECLCFLVILIFSLLHFVTPRSQNVLRKGSSLSVKDTATVLTSPDKTFTCGFHDLGENAYWFSIWFTGSNRTVVWMANRDKPVNGRGSKVSLRRDGIMIMTDVDGAVAWRSNDSPTDADRAKLLDTGNLVLINVTGGIIWQSFDFPTDTLLPNQPFTKRTKLISRSGLETYTSGYFNLFFDNDKVLRLMYDGPEISSVYWPNPDFRVWDNNRNTYNSTRLAMLDDKGTFLSSDNLQFNASDMDFGIKRRLTMDRDGNLRLYSLDNASGLWTVSWEALAKSCRVHGICGRNGIWDYTPKRNCSCLSGYEIAKPGNWNKGCKPKFNITCNPNSQKVKFIELPEVDFWGYDVKYNESFSLDACRQICLDDFKCAAYRYGASGEGKCYTKNLLFNDHTFSDILGTLYLKMPANFEASEPTTLNHTNPQCPLNEPKLVMGSLSMYKSTRKTVKWPYLFTFVSILVHLKLSS